MMSREGPSLEAGRAAMTRFNRNRMRLLITALGSAFALLGGTGLPIARAQQPVAPSFGAEPGWYGYVPGRGWVSYAPASVPVPGPGARASVAPPSGTAA